MVLMHRFEVLKKEPLNMKGKGAYDKFYNASLSGRNHEAVGGRLPAMQCVSPLLGMCA